MSQQGVPAPGSGIPRTQLPEVQIWEVPFTYDIDFAALAAQSQQTNGLNIQSDSDFKWVKSTYFADVAGGAQTESSQIVPLATVLITDTGTGAQLMNLPIQVSNLFGRGSLPFILPTPYIFKAKSTITFQLANYSAATAYANLRLSMLGTKLYYGATPPASVYIPGMSR